MCSSSANDNRSYDSAQPRASWQLDDPQLSVTDPLRESHRLSTKIQYPLWIHFWLLSQPWHKRLPVHPHTRTLTTATHVNSSWHDSRSFDYCPSRSMQQEQNRGGVEAVSVALVAAVAERDADSDIDMGDTAHSCSSLASINTLNT